MDRYKFKAAFYKKAAEVEAVTSMIFLFAAMLFCCFIEIPNWALLCAVLCMAISGICLRGYYADEIESAKWLRRAQNHAENMYYTALGNAILSLAEEEEAKQG